MNHSETTVNPSKMPHVCLETPSIPLHPLPQGCKAPLRLCNSLVQTDKAPFLGNAFTPSADGWIHLISLGEHPWTSPDGSVHLLQVVDSSALESILKNFDKGNQSGRLLIDYDHESHDLSKRTTAAGWIDKLQIRNNGLWGMPRWSAEGQKDVEGGTYRFLSPVFTLADCEELAPSKDGTQRLRPLKLVDAALTNRPNLRDLQPITNRSTDEKLDLVIDLIKNYGTPEGARKGWETRRGGKSPEKIARAVKAARSKKTSETKQKNPEKIAKAVTIAKSTGKSSAASAGSSAPQKVGSFAKFKKWIGSMQSLHGSLNPFGAGIQHSSQQLNPKITN